MIRMQNQVGWSVDRDHGGNIWIDILIGAIVILASLLFVKLFEQIKEDGNQLISEAEIYHSISETSCPL